MTLCKLKELLLLNIDSVLSFIFLIKNIVHYVHLYIEYLPIYYINFMTLAYIVVHL
jgi:hypothetical protein